MGQAHFLVELLLEMNILNTRDYQRQVRKLASDIHAPEASAWFEKAAGYFIQNMDHLAADQERPGVLPSEYAPEPWSRPSKMTTRRGTEHPFNVQHGSIRTPKNASKDLLVKLLGRGEWGAEPWGWDKEPPTADTFTLQAPVTGATDAEREAQAEKLKKKGFFTPKPLRELPAVYRQEERPWADLDESLRGRALRTLRRLFEAGQPVEKLPEFKTLSRMASRNYGTVDAIRKALEGLADSQGLPRQAIDQALKSKDTSKLYRQLAADGDSGAFRSVFDWAMGRLGKYVTTLHRPTWKGRIEQEFDDYTSQTAPEQGLPKKAPSKKDAPGWLQKKWDAGAEADTKVFRGLRTADRDLWKRLEDLVDYLNYMHDARERYADSKNEAELELAQEAKELFARLDGQPGDVSNTELFLQLLDRSDRLRMREASILDGVDGVVHIHSHNDLNLLGLTTAEALHKAANAYTRFRTDADKGWMGAGIPIHHATWCVRDINTARSYMSRQDVVYLITKGDRNDNYVLMAKSPQQMKDVYNGNLSDEMLREVMPLLALVPDSYLTDHLSRIQALQAEQEAEH